MKCARWHDRGTPVVREIPEGCKVKSLWAKEGFILKADAVPAAWILMRDNCHEFAVFDASAVEPGKYKQKKRMTSKQVEKVFEALKPYLNPRYSFNLDLDTDCHSYSIDYWDNSGSYPKLESLWLSGGKKKNGSLNQAFDVLQWMLVTAKEGTEPQWWMRGAAINSVVAPVQNRDITKTE